MRPTRPAAGQLGRYRASPPLPVGEWRRRPGLDGSWDLGSHQLRIGPGFSVRDRSGALVWWTDGPMIAAASSHIGAREVFGHVSLTEQRRIAADVHLTEVTASAAGALLRGLVGPWRWQLQLTSTPEHLQIRLRIPGADQVSIRTALEPRAAVHGLGAQTRTNLRGTVVGVLSREQGVGRGRPGLTQLAELTKGAGGSPTSTYTAIARAIAEGPTEARSFDLAGSAVSVWDLRRDLTVTNWADELTLTLAAGPPGDLLPDPPGDQGVAWNLPGIILGAQGGRPVAEDKLRRLTDAGVEVSALWLQDWCGQRRTSFGDRVWWRWQADAERYPDFPGWSRELAASGVQTFLYANPFLAETAEDPSWRGRNLYAEAREHGFLVTGADGAPHRTDQDGFEAALVDLSNPEAGAWFSDELRAEYQRIGATGGMADFGEGPPFDARPAGGPARRVHNAWPMLWARHQPGGWAFHRSASSPGEYGSDRPAMMWAGDQTPTWDHHDGMASALGAILSAGVSGQPLMHADVGGYTAINQGPIRVRRSPELLLRWAEWSVFSPVLRTHEGNQPWHAAQVWDDHVLTPFARLAQMFTALTDYRGLVIDRALAQGWPAMAPLWLRWPGSRAATAASRDFSYLFGGFLVVPVLRPGRRRISTVLPPGTWEHLWTGRRFTGDQAVQVDAPLGRPAVFHQIDDDAAAAAAEDLRHLGVCGRLGP